MSIHMNRAPVFEGALYNLNVLVSVDPENYFPFEVSYEVTFPDNRFKERVINLEPKLCFNRSFLFFDIANVRVIGKNRLETIHYDEEESVVLDKKVTYRESNERAALKTKRRLEAELKHYLDYESHIFRMLLKSKEKYSAGAGVHHKDDYSLIPPI